MKYVLEPLIAVFEWFLKLVAFVVAIPLFIVAWIIGLPFALLLHGRLSVAPLPELGTMARRLF